MNKDEGNFWNGFIFSRWINGGNRNRNNNGGCLSSIMGILILAIVFVLVKSIGWGGLIAVFVILFVVIPIIVGIKKGNSSNISNTSGEAWNLYREGKYTLALEKAEKIADKNADAADLAGVLYFHGQGCDKNKTKAFRYFRMGEKNNLEAKTFYALMLLNGDGCDQNLSLGKQELFEAASKSEIVATFMLGHYQIYGDCGFDKNIEAGLRNLRVAMEAGNLDAKYEIAMLKFIGDDVPSDEETAIQYFKEAAAAGHKDSQEMLDKINGTSSHQS